MMKSTISVAAIFVLVAACVVGAAASGPQGESAANQPILEDERYSSTGESPRRSVQEFVSSEGQLDLEAVRRSGYEGPLDLTGFDVRVGGPLTGR